MLQKENAYRRGNKLLRSLVSKLIILQIQFGVTGFESPVSCAIGNSKKETSFLKEEAINCVGQTIKYVQFSTFYIYSFIFVSKSSVLELPGVGEGGVSR